MTYEEIRNDPTVRTYVQAADDCLAVLGYTEHSFAHVSAVAEKTGYILEKLGFPARTAELGRIAGFLHDIGNLINRDDHSQSGGIMAFRILDHLNFPPEEIAMIVAAIGNHDEGTGVPVSPMAAALILADKSDVRRSRVRTEQKDFDIHDRVNYSVTKAELKVSDVLPMIVLKLQIDTHVGSVMEYFEIFMERMILCRKAAEMLGMQFKLIINEQPLL